MHRSAPQAFAGGDWFEVAIGLYDDSDTIKDCKVYRGKKMDSYTSDFMDVPVAGKFKLGFFAASYDRTGGTVLGATLKVKQFSMTVSSATDATTGSSSQKGQKKASERLQRLRLQQTKTSGGGRAINP